MVYKIGNIKDLESLPSMDDVTTTTLYEYAKVLTYEYGEDRDIDHSDGGYILYATEGTPAEDIKEYFDYTQNTIEYVNRSGHICSAMYLLTNDFAVVIVLSIADAPKEITDAFEEGY